MPRERIEGLVRSLYAVGGGALAVSLYLFLGADALQLGEDLVGALQAAWALLFYSLAAAALAQFFAAAEIAPRAGRFILASTVAALVAGLVLLAFVCGVAIRDANAPEEEGEHAVRAGLYPAPAFLVELPNAAGARAHPGSRPVAPRRERRA